MHAIAALARVHGPPVAADLDALTALAAGAVHAVILVDGAVEASGYGGRVRDALDTVSTVTTHPIEPGEPTARSIDLAADVIRASGRGTVTVAVGGGTALDTAKLAASAATGQASVERYALAVQPLPARGPLAAIPTTSGTGSEITRTCVFSTADGRKVWAWGDALLPDLVVLDASATTTMPPTVTATTGLDALVHAVESATGRRSDDAVMATAADAVRLVVEHLPRAVANGDDLDARAGMQAAALLAGVAIDAAGTGIAHALGHALGTHAHVPHGAAVAVALSAALEWNLATESARYAPLADAFGTTIAALADRYATLLVDVRIADAIGAVGTIDVDPVTLAETMDAEENRPMHDNNCRIPDHRDRLTLAAAAVRSWNELARAGRGRQ